MSSSSYMATEEKDTLLKPGAQAPEISLDTDSGEHFKLSSLAGKNVVLYFYPKADTPGCTKESCEFRDTLRKFKAANTVIVGVSPDASKAQAKFKDKFDLPFTLLADVDHKAAEALWGLEGKEHVRQEVHGHRADDVCDWSRRPH